MRLGFGSDSLDQDKPHALLGEYVVINDCDLVPEVLAVANYGAVTSIPRQVWESLSRGRSAPQGFALGA
jgi:hypothetical protein